MERISIAEIMLEEFGDFCSMYIGEDNIEGYVITAYYNEDGSFVDEYGWKMFNVARYVSPNDIYMIQRTNCLLLWKGPGLFLELINIKYDEKEG